MANQQWLVLAEIVEKSLTLWAIGAYYTPSLRQNSEPLTNTCTHTQESSTGHKLLALATTLAR